MSNLSTANVIAQSGYIKRVLVKSAMAACVASSSTAFISQYTPITSTVNPRVSNYASEQKVRVIEKTSLAYNKPRYIAKPYLISGPKERVVSMQNTPENYQHDDFEFAVTAMDKLGDIDVLHPQSKNVITGAAVKHVTGKMIPPDEDDFMFDGSDLDTL